MGQKKKTGELVLNKDNTFGCISFFFFFFFCCFFLFSLSLFFLSCFSLSSSSFLLLIRANVFFLYSSLLCFQKQQSPGSTRDGKVSELVKCLLAIFASLETTTIVRGCKRQSSTKSRTKKKKSNQRKETRDHFLPQCQTVYIYLTRQPGRLNLPVDHK